MLAIHYSTADSSWPLAFNLHQTRFHVLSPQPQQPLP